MVFIIDTDETDEMINIYLSEMKKIIENEHFYENSRKIEEARDKNLKLNLLKDLFVELQKFANEQKGKSI